MTRTVALTFFVAVALLARSGPTFAEPVAGSDRMLCTAQQVSVCAPFEECRSGSPVDWNLPDFVVVDVAAKMLSTTPSNERPRASAIPHLQREQGVLYLQGMENGRAFTIVIVEESGDMSATVSTPNANISVYGACTPLPAEPPKNSP
jgi:hypothetical protein